MKPQRRLCRFHLKRKIACFFESFIYFKGEVKLLASPKKKKDKTPRRLRRGREDRDSGGSVAEETSRQGRWTLAEPSTARNQTPASSGNIMSPRELYEHLHTAAFNEDVTYAELLHVALAFAVFWYFAFEVGKFVLGKWSYGKPWLKVRSTPDSKDKA